MSYNLAAAQAYTDSAVATLNGKQAATLATTAALPTNIYVNGTSGVGATLTGTATGTLTVDGTVVALNMVVLVKNEATAANNGLYLCTLAGAGGVAYILTRVSDMNSAADFLGASVLVVSGTVNAGQGFYVTGLGPFTVGTTAVNWLNYTPVDSTTIPSAASATAPTAGVATTLARADHVHPRSDWQAADHNFLVWNFDPVNINTTSNPLTTGGTIFVIKMHTPVAISVTNLWYFITTIGSGNTSGQCFGALIQNGTFLGFTGDLSGVYTGTTGTKTAALAGGPYAVAAGDFYVGFWFQGGTGPALGRAAASTTAINAGLSAAVSRFGIANTGLTTTSGVTTLSTIVASTPSYWAAVS